MKRLCKIFLLGIAAGLAIGLGGLAFLACSAAEHKIAGSFLFSIGLLTVCSFGLFLYTGKIGYVFENKPSYLLDLLVGYLGNIVGAVGLGYLCYAIPAFRDGGLGATASSTASLRDILAEGGQPFYASLIWGFICGIFVFIAVDLFKKKPGVIGVFALVLAVAAFVAIGSEHCIANYFYFSASNHWTGGTVLDVLLVTVGNSIGSLAIWGLTKLAAPKEEAK